MTKSLDGDITTEVPLSATFEFKLLLRQNVPANGHVRTCEVFAVVENAK